MYYSLILGILILALMALVALIVLPSWIAIPLMTPPYGPYSDPEWTDPPPLAQVYEGESARLVLGEDGRFEAQVGDETLAGNWTASGPSPGFSTVAAKVHLQDPGGARLAVLRWDGALGFEGVLLEPESRPW